MQLKKNDVIVLEITDVSNDGSGVGRYENMAIFVPDAAVGDIIECLIVKVKSTYCYGKAIKLVTASKHRCDPDCPVSSRCGGCSFRHMNYDEECRLKDKFIRDSFERIGKLSPEFLPFVKNDRVDNYRNKAQFPLAEIDGRAVCGFFAKRSHRVIEHYDCKLQPAIFSQIVKFIMAYVNTAKIPVYSEITHKGLLRHIYLRRGEHSGEIMVCFVVTDMRKANFLDGLADMLIEKFPEIKSVVLNENSKNTNVILGSKLKNLRGSGNITDIMCSNKITISPLSFYQVNTRQAEKLYSIAEEFAELDKDTVLLDLYCGTGTVGLSMCRRVKKLIGIEVIPEAIGNAKHNAKVNGLDNTEFICGDAGTIAKVLFDRGERPDVIICDPARKGCDALSVEYMAKMSPQRIVYISCNHSTAARDCAVLDGLGYSCEKVVGVDLFSRTTGVECVILLRKREAQA